MDPSGEFYARDIFDPVLREVAKDYELLENQLRTDIADFDEETTALSELQLLPTACLLEPNDPDAIRYRDAMLERLSIPLSGGKRQPTDWGWKRYADGVVRLYFIPRDQRAPVAVKVVYAKDTDAVERVYLLGSEEAVRQEKRLGKSPEQTDIDNGLRTRLGLTSDDIDALNEQRVSYEDRLRTLTDLTDLQHDTRYASFEVLQPNVIAHKRRAVVRALFPLRGQVQPDQVNDTVKAYRDYLRTGVDGPHVDRFTRKQLLDKEQHERIDSYNARLSRLRIWRNVNTVVGGAICGVGVTIASQELFDRVLEDAHRGSQLVASIVGAGVLVVSLFKTVSESDHPDIKKADIPTQKTVKDQLEYERRLVLDNRNSIRSAKTIRRPLRALVSKAASWQMDIR